MQALFIVCVALLIAVLAWCFICLRRVSRGHWIKHPERSLWFPAVFGIICLLGTLSIVQERDEEARLAMEREVVAINDCPAPAAGLSDTVALIVNAPAGVQPRVEQCLRVQERATAARERFQRRKDKIAEVR